MTRWFRFYDDSVNDPKILKLSDNLYRIWVGLLCLASKNNGVLPAVDDICLVLRLKPSKVLDAISKLTVSGLIDDNDGELSPHNWSGRQYKSDSSNERVKRFRERQCNVTVTPPETEQIQKQIQKDIPTVAKATRRDVEFEEFWKSYPRRDGANPKEPAAKLFSAAVKAGADPRDIIGGARRCAIIESKHVGTPYIPQAVKWLRDKRWLDYPRLADQSVAVSGFYAAGDSEQLAAWDAHVLKTRGKGLPRDRNGGWRVSAEWPPGYQRQERVEAPPIPMLRAVQ